MHHFLLLIYYLILLYIFNININQYFFNKKEMQKALNKFNYHYKIIIVGDSGVGKTNILCQYC